MIIFLVVLAIACIVQLALVIGAVYVIKTGRVSRLINPDPGMSNKQVSTIYMSADRYAYNQEAADEGDGISPRQASVNFMEEVK